jgi:CRISPR-associated endonuclease/helicase Cas3
MNHSTNMPIHLLAKSSYTPDSPNYYESYVGHIIETAHVARHIVGKHGNSFLHSMGLEPSIWQKELLAAVSRGAYLHDVGKANHHFQRIVRRKSAGISQAFRHELVSIMLALEWEPLSRWIFDDCSEDVEYAALCAVAGHHLKFKDAEFTPREGSGDEYLVVYTGHDDVKKLLKKGKDLFGIPVGSHTMSFAGNIELDLLGDPFEKTRKWFIKKATPWWEGIEINEEKKKFVALVKSIVVGSDIIASAVLKNEDPVTWIDRALPSTCSTGDLCNIVESRLQGKSPRQFQINVKNSASRVTFVNAGCGTGKTAAAYMWAAEKVKERQRKLFVCYPTTGTATEGYKDYALHADIDSRLLHSRAEVDLESILEADPSDGSDESTAKYSSLSAYDIPMVVATADTVLGLIQNNRTGLFSFPAIADAAFVFDEIHTYDRKLFGALLRFLDTFPGLPVLLMTASLHNYRIRAIEKILSKRGEKLHTIHGPRELEEARRYAVHFCNNDMPWSEVLNALGRGEKVLWVANTVERACEIASSAVEHLKSRQMEHIKPQLYHSRYKYVDRVKHHCSVVEGFNREKNCGPMLAVTTQVCEVSLDISADLLVTDVAPVPALIQRMGRVNRHLEDLEHVTPKQVYIVDPPSPSPYEEESLSLARKWIGELECHSAVSQADLDRAFRSIESDEIEGSDIIIYSQWLDGGLYSEAGPLRENGYTISVIMGEDLRHVLKRRVDGREFADSKELVKYTIPMLLHPVIKEIREWRRLNNVLVAPDRRIRYSDIEGGAWN